MTPINYDLEVSVYGTEAELAARLRQLASKIESGSFLPGRAKKNGRVWVHGINAMSIRVDTEEG